MSATTLIAQAFGEDANLYTDVLGLPTAGKDAEVSPAQLRKAYYRRALLFHPDKQASKTSAEQKAAKLKFQAVSLAYNILSDSEKRAEYDESGEINDDDDEVSDDWTNYFKNIFGSISTKDIDSFAEKYKCSEEEEQDVLKYYKRFKGDLNKMLECVMLSAQEDKKRWVDDYIKPSIEKGDVPDYSQTMELTMEQDEETEPEEDSSPSAKAATKKAAKKKRKKKEAEPDEDLIAMIRGNAQKRGGGARSANDFMAGLAQKYGGNIDNDIPDDEFEKTRARLDAQRKKGKSRK